MFGFSRTNFDVLFQTCVEMLKAQTRGKKSMVGREIRSLHNLSSVYLSSCRNLQSISPQWKNRLLFYSWCKCSAKQLTLERLARQYRLKPFSVERGREGTMGGDCVMYTSAWSGCLVAFTSLTLWSVGAVPACVGALRFHMESMVDLCSHFSDLLCIIMSAMHTLHKTIPWYIRLDLLNCSRMEEGSAARFCCAANRITHINATLEWRVWLHLDWTGQQARCYALHV